MKDGRFWQSVDIRYPACITRETLHAALDALAQKAGGRYEPGAEREPFSIDPDTPEVQILTQTYHELTGRDDPPFSMGGGTYARCFARARSAVGRERPVSCVPTGREVHTARMKRLDWNSSVGLCASICSPSPG